MTWIKSHWRKVAGVACGVATVVLVPVNASAAAALGVVCGAAFGTDADVGKVLGQGIEAVIEAVRGKKPNG